MHTGRRRCRPCQALPSHCRAAPIVCTPLLAVPIRQGSQWPPREHVRGRPPVGIHRARRTSSHLIDSTKRCRVRGGLPNSKAMASTFLRRRFESNPWTYIRSKAKSGTAAEAAHKSSKELGQFLAKASNLFQRHLDDPPWYSSMKPRNQRFVFFPCQIQADLPVLTALTPYFLRKGI